MIWFGVKIGKALGVCTQYSLYQKKLSLYIMKISKVIQISTLKTQKIDHLEV